MNANPANEILTALHRIMEIAEPRRLQRATTRTPSDVSWNGQAWTGTCEGAHGETYSPRIALVPQRAFNCNCRDRQARAHQVGPCKHVIALAASGLILISLSE